MNNMLDELIEMYAKLQCQKEPVGMDTSENKTNDGWREDGGPVSQGK